MRIQNCTLLVLTLLLASFETNAQATLLTCQIDIEKNFSEGGPPRRYTNSATVTFREDGIAKRIALEGSNFSVAIDTSSAYTSTGWVSSDRSSDTTWDLAASYSIQGSRSLLEKKIRINRSDGRIEAFVNDVDAAGGWMKVLAMGSCSKVDPTKLKF